MDTFSKIVLTIIIIIFISIILLTVHIFANRYHHRNYQRILVLNNKYFNKNHKKWNKKFYCPKGCNNKGKCVKSKNCFNCHSQNPECCCYDLQCSGCIKR